MTSPGRGTAYLMLAQGVILLSGFAVSLILARGMGPVGYGDYGVVISVLSWLERTLTAGIPAATISLVARADMVRGAVETNARFILIAWSLPLFAGLWLLAPTLGHYFGMSNGTEIFRIAAFNIPAMALFIAYDGILNSRRQFSSVSLLQIIQATVKLVGVLALLIWIGMSAHKVFVAHVLASIVPVAIALLAWPLGKDRISGAVMRAMVRLAIPMTAYAVSLVVLMNISLWQLEGAIGEGPTGGYYVAAMNLTKMLMVIPSVTSGVLFVSVSWAISEGRQDLVQKYVFEAGRFALITLGVACTLLWTDADGIMLLLYGEAYAGSGVLLAWLGVAFAAVAWLDVYFHAIMARGSIAGSALALACMVPVLAALNMWWIPLWGARGAAMATTAAMLLGALLASIMTVQKFGYLLRFRTLLRVAAACAIVGVLSQLIVVDGILLVVKLGALGLLYVAILFALGELALHDIKPFLFWKADKKV